ncbi:MAG: hypothetical protein ACI8VT_001371 [Saprospiraceae bacterium]|jgi:hypothetical protein
MTHHQPGLINWFSEHSHAPNLSAYVYADLIDLDLTGTAIGRNIIGQLLKNNTLDISLNTSKETDEKLFRLKTDNKNSADHSAFQPLGLGFPIIKLNNSKTKETSLAPLFIWAIHLEDQNTSYPSWKITHNQNDTIRLNYALCQYIKTNFKLDLLKLAHSLFANKKINALSLSKICYELSSVLGKKEDFFIDNLQAIYQKSENNILCSGAISNFYDPLLFSKTTNKAKTKEPATISHPFSTSTLDPWQRKAFHKIWQYPHSHIIADPGNGKSHLLHYTLINALSNGLTNLVLADSVHRIKKIRQELSVLGLDHLMLDITDPEKDITKIVQALTYKSTVPKEEFEEPYFKYLINLCQRHIGRLDTSFQVLEHAIFDKASWPDIVGNHLRYNRIEKHELLDNFLDARDFTFHPTEYLSLKEVVNISEPIYKKINNLKYPLHGLHPDIFLEKAKPEAKAHIEKQLDLFYKKFDQLHHRYIFKQQDYAKDLNNTEETFFQEALLKIEALKDQIEDNRLLYENDFEDIGLMQTGKLKVYGVFSGKHKNILQARNLINEQFKILRHFLNQEPTGHFEVIENIDSKSISRVSAQLNDLEDQVYQWHDSVPERLLEELQRLNTKSVHSSLDYEEQINELEYTLDMNIEELNTSGLYANPFQNKMLTIPMRQFFIQDIIDQLQNTKNHLKDFDDYYEWQRHWLLLPEIHRKVLTAIIKANPQNWQAAFQSWYFYQRLKAGFHFKMPKNEKPLATFETDIKRLQEILPTQIRQWWKQKATLKKTSKELANISLPELFNTHYDLLTQQFPVIVTTSQVAARLGLNKPLFNLAFIFMPSNDTKEEDFPPNQFAQRTLSFSPLKSDEQVIPGTVSFLNIVHKKTPYPIFDFANHLIYQRQKSLVNFSALNSSPFTVKKLSGQLRQEINIREAEAIIDELIKIASKREGIIPRIAIVCTTVKQRDFITRKILQLSLSGQTDAAQLEKLRLNGLGVFHLKETCNNTFDQLFFSLGFHSFTNNTNEMLTFLNTKSGYKTLENLMSANFSTINIYHSIPEEDIDHYLSYKTKKGTRLIASWIKYATASATNNQEDQNAVFKSFTGNEPTPKNKLTEEIANELAPYIGKNRICLNYNFNGVLLPLIILPTHEKGKPVAILSDGCLSIENSRAHLWNIEFLKLLKSQGLSPISAWSANWFENPALEARKLASAILKMDKIRS